MSVAWIRFFNAVRWWTRWSRKRARSRSARTSGVGSGDLGHEVTSCELGQHPRVDLVGLGGERGNTLDLGGIGDRDIPASELEGVVDEARPGHRLDRGAHLLPSAQDEGSQRPERVDVRTDGGHLDRSPVLIEYVHVEPLARQVQSGVQHVLGLLVLVALTTQRCHQRGPSS
jgi:hypothetical protein